MVAKQNSTTGGSSGQENQDYTAVENEPVDQTNQSQSCAVSVWGSALPLCAVRCVIFTVDPTEARRAGAGVAVHAVGAVGSIPARIALAFVDVFLALQSPEPRQAGTQEAVDLVLTKASVAAGV